MKDHNKRETMTSFRINSQHYLTAVILLSSCINGQLVTKIACSAQKQLRCAENRMVEVESISIKSNHGRCTSDCSETLTDDMVAVIASRCTDESSCELDFLSLKDLRPDHSFECPGTGGPPSHSNSGLLRNSYHLIVEYICRRSSEDVSEFTIVEEDSVRWTLGADETQVILSPLYPTMTDQSQDVSCVFTRSLPFASRFTTVRLTLLELDLPGLPLTEELTITPDNNKATQGSYSSPITIKEENEIAEDITISENFTVHFNRCTTLTSGGKFKLEFRVDTGFEVICTHVYSECETPILAPPNTQPDTDNHDTNDEESTNIGVIIGGVIGGLLFLVILLVIIIIALLYTMRKRRKQNIPVQKREQKQPIVARYSSYPDRASNIYQEIRDSGEYYTEIGRVDSVISKQANYDDRPAPAIPKERNATPGGTPVANRRGIPDTEPGYDQIKEKDTNGVDVEKGVTGKEYMNPEQNKNTKEDENGNNTPHHSYLQLIGNEDSEYDKPRAVDEKDDYAKLNRDRGSSRRNVDPAGNAANNLHRLDSEIVMEDNTDLYNSELNLKIGEDNNDVAGVHL